jgi:hypothetical protein
MFSEFLGKQLEDYLQEHFTNTNDRRQTTDDGRQVMAKALIVFGKES